MRNLLVFYELEMIDKSTFISLKEIVSLLQGKYMFELEAMKPLISHLVMAIIRIRNHEYFADNLSTDIIQEIINCQHYSDMIEIMSQISKCTKVTFSQTEEYYILLHLVNLFR